MSTKLTVTRSFGKWRSPTSSGGLFLVYSACSAHDGVMTIQDRWSARGVPDWSCAGRIGELGKHFSALLSPLDKNELKCTVQVQPHCACTKICPEFSFRPLSHKRTYRGHLSVFLGGPNRKIYCPLLSAGPPTSSHQLGCGQATTR